MAQGLNKVMLIGNLGADPELKYTQNGQAVLRLRLATNESYVNKAKERQERTEWHTVVVWGPRAEGLNKILSKGKSLYVEGRIQTRQWDDKEGHKRTTTEVISNEIVLLGGGQGGRSESRASTADVGGYGYDGGGEPFGGDVPVDQFNDDDIPF